MNRTLRIRLGIVAVASLLTLLVTIQPSHSQIGGNPGNSIRGGPPIGPGMPGQPGSGISGISGIGGRPGSGISGMAGRPGFPSMPAPPSGIGGTGIGGAIGARGIGGGAGGAGFETEWLCGLCRKVLARGPTPPAETICPLCRTTNVAPGGRPGFPNPGGGFTPPPLGGPPALPPVGGMPAINNPPLIDPQPRFVAPRAPHINAQGVDTYTPPPSWSRSSSSTKWILITLAMLVLLAVGIGGVIFAIANQKPAKKPRRKARRRLIDDDDDY